MVHISHGMMRFASGKMSSRKGNVVTGVALLEQMREYVREKIKDSSELISQASLVDAVAVSAIKYSIIRQALGHDIIFDFETSVSFEGDSGPYIQYTYARTASILAKAGEVGIEPSVENKIITTGDLERQLDRFPDVVRLASIEHAPHHIATYLIELSRAFNAYYAETRIVEKDNDESSYRIALTKACNTVLAQGLYLLGIKAPEKM
jgi:arginyl-tRNA synthetase